MWDRFFWEVWRKKSDRAWSDGCSDSEEEAKEDAIAALEKADPGEYIIEIYEARSHATIRHTKE